jgi:hypothetical protein
VILVIGGVVLAMVRYLVDLLLFVEIEKLNEKKRLRLDIEEREARGVRSGRLLFLKRVFTSATFQNPRSLGVPAALTNRLGCEGNVPEPSYS